MTRAEASTERLELRRFSGADAAGFLALNADPEVLRHTGDEPFANVEAARAFLAAYDHYERNGFGRWSVYLRDGERFIGFAGLRRDPRSGEVDLGFRIARSEWGLGLATEAGSASLELGFRRYGLERIIGRAMPENMASHRVLAKLGFVERGLVVADDGRWLVYELTREAFEAAGAPA